MTQAFCHLNLHLLSVPRTTYLTPPPSSSSSSTSHLSAHTHNVAQQTLSSIPSANKKTSPITITHQAPSTQNITLFPFTKPLNAPPTAPSHKHLEQSDAYEDDTASGDDVHLLPSSLPAFPSSFLSSFSTPETPRGERNSLDDQLFSFDDDDFEKPSPKHNECTTSSTSSIQQQEPNVKTSISENNDKISITPITTSTVQIHEHLFSLEKKGIGGPLMGILRGATPQYGLPNNSAHFSTH